MHALQNEKLSEHSSLSTTIKIAGQQGLSKTAVRLEDNTVLVFLVGIPIDAD